MRVVTRRENPVVIIGMILTLVGMLLYPHLTWMTAIGVGLCIGAYLDIEIEGKEK